MKPSDSIREPAFAGMFYLADKSALTSQLGFLLSGAKSVTRKGTTIAIIAPHAGYQYSGQTAAHAFCQVQGASFDTVAVVSPSHREYFDGISVYDGSAYSTPLGTIGIDAALRKELTENDPIISISAAGHRDEHALEVQIPFIQQLFSGVSILPIVIGDQRRAYCYHLGEQLARVLTGRRSLLVASSDLSHYHDYDAANALDRVIIEDVKDFDYDKLMTDLESNRVEACGGGPIVSVMIAARMLGAESARILHHCNSGDITGEHDRVVGYLAAAFLRAT